MIKIFQDKSSKIKKICKQYKVLNLYVFGSVLTDKFNNTSDIAIDNISVKKLNKACVWTNIDASNWLRGLGQIQLTLDAVASDVVDYDNTLGSGDINVGIDCNELTRRTGAFAVVTSNGEEVTDGGYVVYE